MKYNPKVKIIYIEAPDLINDCVKRREGQIDISVYNRMNNNFDFPQLYECDELVIYKEHKDNENETFTFTSNESPQTLPIETRILNDLRVTRGAMILNGYDCYESCIKYMDNLIKKYEKTDSDDDFKLEMDAPIDDDIQDVIENNFWNLV